MTSDALPSQDLVESVSSFGFDETVLRLTQAIATAGLHVFSTIDHAAGARSVGLNLPPTLVIVYGHAKGGTPVMAAHPNAALDLPLRVLVREREDAKAVVAFHPIATLLSRDGVPEALAARLEPAQQLLVRALAD